MIYFLNKHVQVKKYYAVNMRCFLLFTLGKHFLFLFSKTCTHFNLLIRGYKPLDVNNCDEEQMKCYHFWNIKNNILAFSLFSKNGHGCSPKDSIPSLRHIKVIQILENENKK